MSDKKMFAPSILAAAFVAIVLFIIQLATGKGLNLGLFAVVFAIPAGANIVKVVKTADKGAKVGAVVDSAAAIILAVIHFIII